MVSPGLANSRSLSRIFSFLYGLANSFHLFSFPAFLALRHARRLSLFTCPLSLFTCPFPSAPYPSGTLLESLPVSGRAFQGPCGFCFIVLPAPGNFFCHPALERSIYSLASMRLKHPDQSPQGGFVFYYRRDLDGEAVQVRGNGIGDLAAKAGASLRNNGMAVPADLKLIVEHQICLRQPEPEEACWSGGIGDDVHFKWMRPVLKAVAAHQPKNKLGRAVAKAAMRLAGCSSCSGTRVYQSGRDNTGRAGKLNRLGKGLAKLAGIRDK